MRRLALALSALALAGAGCAARSEAEAQDARLSADGGAAAYATELVAFAPGGNAGYGSNALPDVVLGPPMGGGPGKGGLDVVSLGIGGEIVLGFGERVITDEPGPDFIVFENAFWAGGDPRMPFVDPGEVAVSRDGVHFRTFECDPDAARASKPSGCAGARPVLAYEQDDGAELDPQVTGGDPFDLADVGLERAAFVRIRDLADEGEGTSAGLDLDAVGLIHHDER